jgi:hypothetical protein
MLWSIVKTTLNRECKIEMLYHKIEHETKLTKRRSLSEKRERRRQIRHIRGCEKTTDFFYEFPKSK